MQISKGPADYAKYKQNKEPMQRFEQRHTLNYEGYMILTATF